jgi:uncharacterized protein YoxC
MNTIILAVIAVAVALMAAFVIPMLLELKRTLASLRQTMEQNLAPTLDELQVMLKSVHSISDNVNDITGDVKQLSSAVGQVGKKIQTANAVVDAVSSSLTIRTLSLNAGIRAALSYIIANLTGKGERT